MLSWRYRFLLLFLLLAPSTASADEGMYLLYEGGKLPMAELQKRGLSLSLPQVQGLGKAIVQLARGGTGSFVSPQGLIVTNHHVAYSCLAALDATTHKGLMKHGYVAANRSLELPCPAYDLLAVKDVVDVTALVHAALTPTPKSPASISPKPSSAKPSAPLPSALPAPAKPSAPLPSALPAPAKPSAPLPSAPPAPTKPSAPLPSAPPAPAKPSAPLPKPVPSASSAPAPRKRGTLASKLQTAEDRAKALRVRTRTLEAECEAKHQAICQIRPLNHGAAWSMSIYQRLRDIRLVYAPAGTLGKFGGDIDNWRYPRHTADFTFLRAYASPQGQGLPYKKTNLPYASKDFLRIASSGVKKGDLTLVLGFPGSTYRHTTVPQALYQRQRGVVKRAQLFRKLLAALPKDDLGKRRYQNLDAGLNNSAKYYEDLQEQFDKFKVLEHKKDQDQAIQKRLASEPPRLRAYQKTIRRIEKIYRGYRTIDEKALLLTYVQSSLFRSLQAAVDIVRWSQVRRLTDLERPGERYRDKELYQVHQSLQMVERLTTLQGEKALLLAAFRHALALPASQQLHTAHWLKAWGQAEVDALKEQAASTRISFATLYAAATRQASPTDDPLQAAIDLLYGQTRLYAASDTDPAAHKTAATYRRLAFTWSQRQIRRSRDPLLQLAVRLLDELDALSKGLLRPFDLTLTSSILPSLVKDVIRPPYWDANFTLRLNYGTVVDYHERKIDPKTQRLATTTHRYMTDLKGLMAKVTGKDPFEIPAGLSHVVRSASWGRWLDPQIGDIPVNFTTTLDTTGGNSGSPVLNGRGELIGLLFDGTPEAILSDWLFLPDQRSICMDIRFALFLADRLDKASALLQELGW